MPSAPLDDDTLRELGREIEANPPTWIREWRGRVARFLEEIAVADLETRATREFQAKLWNDNPISTVGAGTVSVEVALDDHEFRRWLAEVSLERLPGSEAGKLIRLKEIFHRIYVRFEGQRMPWLKTFRLLAAVYPDDFTCMASTNRLHEYAAALLEDPPRDSLAQHLLICRRLEQILGRAKADSHARAARITLHWSVYEQAKQIDEERLIEAVPESNERRLKPLPAARRRKGLTALGGYLATVIGLLEMIGDGITREDLLDGIRAERPTLKDSSHSMIINQLQGEFGVIYRDGTLYKLTPMGQSLLETGDPDVLDEWLLTRVLGFDWALVHLHRSGSLSNIEFQRVIQRVNPGWKGLFAPSSMVAWLQGLQLIERNHKMWSLTERGLAWLGQIHWEPEALVIDDVDPGKVDFPPLPPTDPGDQRLDLPPFETLYSRLSLPFPKSKVAQLHAGLWSHHRRHFAVLTGLSGSGKTQLALDYANALTGGDEAARKRVKIIPVQPGWYDPGPLLGYVNPIQPGDYVRAPFLEFVQRALAEPDMPYVVLLDEMNLSQPEQYFAPLLSAMETGEAIDLHGEDQLLDGIERRLPYPSNLVIIGTVNMDETTHGLSDKVLDRAFTLEFWDIDVDAWPGWATTSLNEKDQLRTLLGALMLALQPARMHFGWRVIDDVVGFLVRMREFGMSEGYAKDVDAILCAKILPKLRGEDSKRFREALVAARKVLVGCDRCVAKLDELQHDLATSGSARFFR